MFQKQEGSVNAEEYVVSCAQFQRGHVYLGEGMLCLWHLHSVRIPATFTDEVKRTW
jgi:hypothetical protein